MLSMSIGSAGRVKQLERALEESRRRVEALRRDKEAASRQLSNLHVQFTLWKSQQVGRWISQSSLLS
jgi:hypothetical protein